jgi:hypothetical protein
MSTPRCGTGFFYLLRCLDRSDPVYLHTHTHPTFEMTVPTTTTKKANERTDIGMVYLGQEPYLGWGHGVLFGQKQLQVKDALCGV